VDEQLVLEALENALDYEGWEVAGDLAKMVGKKQKCM